MKYLIMISLLALAACSAPVYKNPHVKIYTSQGDIEAELYPDKAPVTVAAFLSYIDSGVYNNTSFYRVVMLEGMTDQSNVGLVQGGTWPDANVRYPFIKGIVHESTQKTGLSHTSGTLSLARSLPGTASTEFFICIGDQSQFDFGNENPPDKQGFSAFGRVLEGMEVVRSIQRQPANGESFSKKIEIHKIKRL